MGGAKKPAPAKGEKQSGSKDKKGKKDKGESGPKKAEITVVINEAEAMKIIKGAKVVTIHELARQTGVKVSAANRLLRGMAERGEVKTVGGYSGHRLYQAA